MIVKLITCGAGAGVPEPKRPLEPLLPDKLDNRISSRSSLLPPLLPVPVPPPNKAPRPFAFNGLIESLESDKTKISNHET